MDELLRELIRLGAGLTDFSPSLWLGMTFLLLLVGGVLAAVSPRVIDPIAVEVAVRPLRVAMWVLFSLAITAVTVVLLTFSWVGIPLATLLLVLLPFVAGLGYVAVALIVGDRITRAYGWDLPPWGAVLVGIALFRLLRAVPFVGGPVHSALLLFGFAATAAVAWDVGLSWHRRRMPDREQFRGEELIEWHPGEGEEPPSEPPAWR